MSRSVRLVALIECQLEGRPRQAVTGIGSVGSNPTRLAEMVLLQSLGKAASRRTIFLMLKAEIASKVGSARNPGLDRLGMLPADGVGWTWGNAQVPWLVRSNRTIPTAQA